MSNKMLHNQQPLLWSRDLKRRKLTRMKPQKRKDERKWAGKFLITKREARGDIPYLFLFWDASLFKTFLMYFREKMNSLCSFLPPFCSFSSLVSVCVSVSLCDDDSVKIGPTPDERLLKRRCSEMFSPSHLFPFHKSPLRAVTSHPALMCCPSFISRLERVERRVAVEHRSGFLKFAARRLNGRVRTAPRCHHMVHWCHN